VPESYYATHNGAMLATPRKMTCLARRLHTCSKSPASKPLPHEGLRPFTRSKLVVLLPPQTQSSKSKGQVGSNAVPWSAPCALFGQKMETTPRSIARLALLPGEILGWQTTFEIVDLHGQGSSTTFCKPTTSWPAIT
jgi:hypothetical protein